MLHNKTIAHSKMQLQETGSCMAHLVIE